jgi:hypothetical protein
VFFINHYYYLYSVNMKPPRHIFGFGQPQAKAINAQFKYQVNLYKIGIVICNAMTTSKDIHIMFIRNSNHYHKILQEISFIKERINFVISYLIRQGHNFFLPDIMKF